jgi:ankyrin repeat protein
MKKEKKARAIVKKLIQLSPILVNAMEVKVPWKVCLKIFRQNKEKVAQHEEGKRGRSALHVAAIVSAPNTFLMELMKVFPPKALLHKDNDGRTPLALSVKYGASSSNVVTILKTNKTAISIMDKDGNSPLHLYLQRGKIIDHTVLEVLIKANRSMLAKRNIAGDVPIQVAINYSATEYVLEDLLAAYLHIPSIVERMVPINLIKNVIRSDPSVVAIRNSKKETVVHILSRQRILETDTERNQYALELAKYLYSFIRHDIKDTLGRTARMALISSKNKVL